MTDLTPRQELEGRVASKLAAKDGIGFRDALDRIRSMSGEIGDGTDAEYEGFLHWTLDVLTAELEQRDEADS
jgi:hypothetical protein